MTNSKGVVWQVQNFGFVKSVILDNILCDSIVHLQNLEMLSLLFSMMKVQMSSTRIGNWWRSFMLITFDKNNSPLENFLKIR